MSALPSHAAFLVTLCLLLASEPSTAAPGLGSPGLLFTASERRLLDAGWPESEASGVQLAIAPTGSALAVWQRGDSERVEIWADNFLPDVGWGRAQRLALTASDSADPQVSMDADGNAAAVWDDGVYLGYHKIWICRYQPTLGWREPELLAQSEGDVSIGSPQVAVAPDGAVSVLWSRYEGSRETVWARGFSPDQGWDAAQEVGQGRDPQVLAGGGARFLAVWEGRGDCEIWGRGVGWDGRWGEPRCFTESGFRPSVSVGADDHVVIVWQLGLAGFGCDRFVPGMGWVGSEVVYDSSGPWRYPVDPRVVVDGRGAALVAWQGASGWHGPFPPPAYVWTGRFEPGSGWQQEPVMAQTGDTSGGSPSVAGNAAGDAIVVWLERDSANYSDLWARRWVRGSGWEPPECYVDVQDQRSNHPSGDLAMTDWGDTHLVWADDGGRVWGKVVPAAP
jgi:hypothetical protein